MNFLLVNMLLAYCILAVFCYIDSNAQQNCSIYSGRDQDSYWDSVGKCSDCNLMRGCGFCLSTLQCLEGTATGPLSEMPCPSWAFGQETCPVVLIILLFFLSTLCIFSLSSHQHIPYTLLIFFSPSPYMYICM